MASIAASVRRCFAGRVRRTPDQDPGTPSTPTAPTAPSALIVTSQTQTSITFRWSPSESTDGLDIAGYKVFQDDNLIALQSSNVAIATGLTAGNSYTFYVIGYTEVLDSEASTDLVASTLASDLIPDTIPSQLKAGVELSTPVTFDPVTISGINGQAYTYISNGTWAKNGSTPTTSSGYVENGDTVVVYNDSAGAPDTAVNTILYITGVGATFTSTTAAADSTPADFSVPSVSGVDFGVPVSSTAVPITGINVPVAISVVGGKHSIDDGVATSAPGTISNGQSFKLHHTSDTQPLTPKTTVVTVAGIDRSFTSTTKADTQAPSVPFQNAPVNVGPDGFTISWQASTDDVEVGGYIVYANGQYKGYTTGDTTFPLSGYPAGTSVTFTVRSFDPSGNVSGPSNSRVGTTPPEPAVNNRTLAGALQVTAVRAAGNLSIATGSPTITSAVLSGSDLTIVGSGFGTKATATPTYFKSWRGVAPGTLATHPDVGIDRYYTDNPQPSMSSYVGIGGNSLYVPYPIPNAQDEGYSMHLQKIVPDTTAVLMSHWMRITCTDSSRLTGTVQIKGHRVGIGTSTDANSNYGSINPRVGWTSFRNRNTLGIPSIGVNEGNYWATAANGSGRPGETYNQVGNPTGIDYGEWVYTESYFKWNTVGSYDGILRVAINNTPLMDSDIEGAPIGVRLTSGDVIRNVQFHPGIQNIHYTGSGSPDFDVWYSRPFVDTGADCLARVFLGNRSTLSECTGRFMLPATSWSGAGNNIVVSDCVDMPSGYDWVYVVKSDGTTSNGVAYT